MTSISKHEINRRVIIYFNHFIVVYILMYLTYVLIEFISRPKGHKGDKVKIFSFYIALSYGLDPARISYLYPLA